MSTPSGHSAGRGFTLIEMILVSLLLSLIFIAAFGLVGSVFRDQSSQTAAAVLYNTATLVDQAMADACDSASFIEIPPLPTGSMAGTLRVWTNIDPADSTPVPGQTPRFSYFCGDTNNHFWLYQGPSATAAPNPVSIPSLTCGANPPAGIMATELAGGAMGITASNLTFKRDDTSQISIYYQLTLPPSAGRAQPPVVVHQTVLAVQEGNQ